MTATQSFQSVSPATIRYADDTSGWADWQRDYRFGVLLILPPSDIARKLDRLRQRYDPASAEISPAHISVSRPLNAKLNDARCDEIRDVLAEVDPFELVFEKPHASPDYAGVSYPVHPQAAIDELKRAIHRASVFANGGHERDNIPAHITVAEFISIEESLDLARELEATSSRTEFTCDRLTLVVPDEQFRFHRTADFPFTGS